MTTDATQTVQFLRDNPNFFQTHPEALVALNITHPHTGNTVSMAERQLVELRDRLKTTEEKLGQMVRFGEENDSISAKVHRLTCRMIEADSMDAVMDSLYLQLLDHFGIPHVAVRLWAVANTSEAREFSPVPLELKQFVGAMLTPYCGHHAVYETASWFGEAAPHLKSFALLPLKRGFDRSEVFGAIVMASEVADRFYAEMGTLYLSRISEMVSAALLKFVTLAPESNA